MSNDKSAPTWSNFAAWSVAGGVFYVLVVWAAMVLMHQDPMDVILRPTKVTAELGAAMLFAMAVAGFSNRKRPVSVRTLRNFLILNVAAVIGFLLVTWGFGALARTGTMDGSEWVAAATGATLVVMAVLGTLVMASLRTNLGLVDDEAAAEDMRERGRVFFYSFVWMAAWGLLLVGLSVAGPGGLLSPLAAGVGALVLVAVLAVLTIAAWRRSDELGRVLSHETGNTGYYLILVLGGGWAMLAHLGFTRAPAPLDWLTLFTVLMFAASFIALGRRKLLTR